mgnify:CR=1 FL=1
MKYRKLLALLSMTVITQGCHYLRPEIYDDTQYISTDKTIATTKMIPRRGSTNTKGAQYLLPLIHSEHEALVNNWNGKGSFELYLFKNNRILNKEGDDVARFSSIPRRRVFLTNNDK